MFVVFFFTALFNSYVITVNQLDAWAFALAVTALLAVGVPWLATRPQPTPSVTAWIGHEQRAGRR